MEFLRETKIIIKGKSYHRAILGKEDRERERERVRVRERKKERQMESDKIDNLREIERRKNVHNHK